MKWAFSPRYISPRIQPSLLRVGEGENKGEREASAKVKREGSLVLPKPSLPNAIFFPCPFVPVLYLFYAWYTGYLFSLLGTSSRETCYMNSGEE